eukprot:1141515-Pelagomonas_calceolata.AAC.8
MKGSLHIRRWRGNPGVPGTWTRHVLASAPAGTRIDFWVPPIHKSLDTSALNLECVEVTLLLL